MCSSCRLISEKREFINHKLEKIKVYSAANADFGGRYIFINRGWPHPFKGPASIKQLDYIFSLRNMLAEDKELDSYICFETYEDLLSCGYDKEAASQIIDILQRENNIKPPEFIWEPPKKPDYISRFKILKDGEI